MRSMSGADSQVVLRASVCAENVLRLLDVEFFEGHGLWHSDLDVEAIAPSVQRRARAVVLYGNQPD